jgi:hypothetical protein
MILLFSILVYLLNSFAQNFIVTNRLKGGVCIGTNKRGWYNDKVPLFRMFRLPQLKSIGDKFELHRFIANLVG